MTLISPVEDQQLELENIRPTHLTCASCKKLLPIEQFYTNRTETSNYNKVYSCKACMSLRQKQYRLQRPHQTVIIYIKSQLKHRLSVPKEFNIDADYLKQIDTTDICPILGIPMRWHAGRGTGKRQPNTKSIDRIDPNRGYIKGNVQIISWRANKIKQDATFEELIKLGKWAETNL